MKYYKAPWSPRLIIMSSLLTPFFLGFAFAELRRGGASFRVGMLLLALVVGCALFSIRGFTVTPDAILVRRLFWNTRLPLAGLQSARFDPLPIFGGIGIGNGGLFSFTGFWYTPSLGFCRLFITDRTRCVWLRYPNRTVVVSPAAPEDFVQDLALAKP
jgi:hypothetical protein